MLHPPPLGPAGRDIEALLAHQREDGALVASPTYSQYPYVWLRDGAFIAHALDRAGSPDRAAAFHGWVARTIHGHGDAVRRLIARGEAGEHPEERAFLPARFDVDGAWHADDWPAFQLDGYGQWLWSLERHVGVWGPPSPLVADTARLVADYLLVFRLEPCYDAWEEGRTQLHTSTLASVAAGLRAAGRLFGAGYESAAEEVVRFMERECVAPHGGGSSFIKAVRNPAVDASLLWLSTPFDLWGAADPRVVATVGRIEAELVRDGGVMRYRSDTFYGGGAWVLLSAWLGWHHARAGNHERAAALARWVDAQRDEDGRLPEQVAVSTTHTRFLRFWTERWGEPARPLLWSHAMRLLLALELR